ncbi:MAG: hypothetical protein IT460_12900 [Planctomycetes bacterium]|nr:hypothetical protein [Planctomycetota bacterium]
MLDRIARLPRRALAAAVAAVPLGAVAMAAFVGAPAAQAADPVPDLAFFREKVEPVLMAVCAQCHAGKGKGQLGLVVHAPGAPVPEADSKKNLDTVSKLLVPGKPEQSRFLLKPLAERDGGVKHEGGDRIFKGTPAYRAWTDFIRGEKGSAKPAAPAASKPAAPAPAPTATGQPDFGFFVARIEPVLMGVCAQCHAGTGKGQFALITHAPGTRFPEADHRRNFETVLRLLVPGKPELSRFLLKPLAERDGGMKHEGGDRISKGDANHKAWTDFIRGEKGPPPPVDEPDPDEGVPVVPMTGLVLEAEDGPLEGGATKGPADGAKGAAVLPGPAGGRVSLRVRAPRRADYLLALRAGPGASGFRLRVDGGGPLDVPASAEGFAEVGPAVPLDGGRPLEGRVGRVVVDGEAVAMDGREGVARWLSPADLPHTKVAAVVNVPGTDDPGRDDAWLLFDALDAENGKFFGLSDGGRRLVMGVVEAGRPRIVKSAEAPEVGGKRPVALSVDLLDGVAVGRVDGKPLLAVNFDRNLGAARFGFLTHGVVVVRSMIAARGGEEVYRSKFATGGVFPWSKGVHVVEVELLPGGAALDAVVVREATE